jgi:hypothetical protein
VVSAPRHSFGGKAGPHTAILSAELRRKRMACGGRCWAAGAGLSAARWGDAAGEKPRGSCVGPFAFASPAASPRPLQRLTGVPPPVRRLRSDRGHSRGGDERAHPAPRRHGGKYAGGGGRAHLGAACRRDTGAKPPRARRRINLASVGRSPRPRHPPPLPRKSRGPGQLTLRGALAVACAGSGTPVDPGDTPARSTPRLQPHSPR